MKGAERRRIKRKTKRMRRKMIVAKRETSKINNGESREIEPLNQGEGGIR